MRYGIWRGLPQSVSGVKKWDYGRAVKPRAVFVHVMDGHLSGTDGWFRNPVSGTVSTQFGIGYATFQDRLEGKVSVYQWVDTVNTAYGTAVTRYPVSPLAKSILGDLIGRIDINHALIHIEVEGYADQRWPPGFVTALNRLLAAIGAAHGPLMVMRHNDVSSKPCPGSATPWSRIVPTYGQRLTTVPDTSTGDPDVAILSRIYRLSPRRVTLKPNQQLYKGPGPSYGKHYLTPSSGMKVEVLGKVIDGPELYGSRIWLEMRRYSSGAKGRFFGHASTVQP